MTARLRPAALALLATVLAGCTTISAVPAGPIELGGDHRGALGRTWSDVSLLTPQREKSVRILTIDGPLLNRLYLAQGLAPGQGLIKAASKEKPTPVYRSDMSPTELVEFVTDSVATLGYQRPEVSGLRPARFGKGDALRFDLKGLTESGLEVSGTAEVAQAAGKLYVVLYLAPSEHYYQTTLPEVEALLLSLS